MKEAYIIDAKRTACGKANKEVYDTPIPILLQQK